MARDWTIQPQSFYETLAWLDPERDIAARKYVQLRADLSHIFRWRKCSDPEGLTDEVFDRVARKVQHVKPAYTGDPRLYFYAVTNNLVKEEQKRVRTRVSLWFIEPCVPQHADFDKHASDREECLWLCLQRLPKDQRDLILAYYSKDKQAKIDHRHELARSLGISMMTLRVRVHRIRQKIAEGLLYCLNAKPHEMIEGTPSHR
ncbi:MAG TPA: sigma-70 family RNA polymerase sigma factor [Pyrinomonadaceae bacterium]